MKKSRLLLFVLSILFVIMTTASIFTLSVNALDNGTAEDGGNWEHVCCGSGCIGGEDYCTGTGTYICCK